MPFTDVPKCYYDMKFLGSADARPLRILSEYIGPKQRLERHKINHTIVFFGSARITSPESLENGHGNASFVASKHAKKAAVYYEKAKELSYRLTQWALGLTEDVRPYIITGGGPGIMEAGNRGAQEAGGLSIGMTISLPHEQQLNPYCTPDASLQFHYFFMRKYWLLFRTRAFIAFPGGIGTFDELFETLTLIQTRKSRKFPIILFGSDYWTKVVNFQEMVDWGVIAPEDVNLFQIFDDVEKAETYLKETLTLEYLAAANNH